MHPEVQSDKEGLCSKCGMKLLPQKKKKGLTRNKHEGHTTSLLLVKFWLSLVLTVPVIFYSDILEKLFGLVAPSFTGSNFIPLILSTVIFLYGGIVFLNGAKRELQAKQPGMMTLIGMAITVAYVYSVYTVFLGGNNLFWELSTLITIMLFGHYLEMRAVQGAQGALKELSKLIPDTAEVLKNGKSVQVKLEEVREKDLILVKPGGRVPTDGIVVEGSSEIDESMITGESKPVVKKEGYDVLAGTINGSGSLKIKVTKIGDKTFLAGVMRLVEEAQSSKSKLQILSDRAAFYLTIVALGSGFVTFVSWIILKNDFSFAMERTVAVLVVACPHALGLAVPLVASISTSMAARSGFLIKQRLSLESARNINIVLFDKTGTLTEGKYGVSKIWTMGISEKDLLRTAASVEIYSEHFTAKAIVEKANSMGIVLSKIKDFKAIPGFGVQGKLGNDLVSIGGNLIANSNFLVNIKDEISRENKKGKTIVYVLKNQKLIGVLSLSDIIRNESKEAVRELKAMKIKTAMITGDSENVASWVSRDLGIDEYFANVKPEDKINKVRILQQSKEKVAMIGDGINDAPALTQADLGVAIGAGTNVAIESAGIILVRNDPRDIVKIIRLSRITYSKMMQNLFWATGYNVIAIPLAAGVLFSKGIILQPALAAVLMSLSTVIVAVNAVQMRRQTI